MDESENVYPLVATLVRRRFANVATPLWNGTVSVPPRFVPEIVTVSPWMP